MRKRNAYVVYDQVAEVYGEWMFAAMNDNDAKRAFITFLEKGDVRREDVILYGIGTYDRVDGVFKGYDIPNMVISGIDVGRKEVIDE